MLFFDATALGEETGGYARYTERLIAPLAARVPLTLLHRPQFAPPAGIAARCSPYRKRLLTELLWLPRAARAATVLHIPAYAGPVVGLNYRQAVLTLHDATQWHGSTGSARDALYWRTVLPRTLQRVRRIVTDSHAAAAAIAAHDRSLTIKLRVVYPGVDELPVGALPPGVPDEPFVLMVGIQPVRKRAALAVRIAACLPEVPFVFAGRGALPPAGNNCRQVGEVTDAQLGALYRRAALLLYPSAEEGFGLPPLEAHLCGCAVVAASSAAVREVAGEACRFVESADPAVWADALRELLADGQARRERAARGAVRAREFTWDAAAEALVAVYRECGL